MSDTPRTDAAQWHDGQVYVVEACDARTLERELAAAKEWKDAVINAAVVGWTYSAADEDDPSGCLSKLLAASAQIALDPQVSSDAEALIERGRQEMRAEVERLRGIVPEFLEKLNDELCAENERLRAEVERLGEALERIARGTVVAATWVSDEARNALKGTK
jgi:vacuolar-type H+-ATPase subunit I/STV1